MSEQRIGKPRSGPHAKSPDSKTGRKVAKRTGETFNAEERARRDRFVEGLLLGKGKREAAIYAGFSEKQAYQRGSELCREPYVEKQFRELRERLTDEQLLTRAEQVLDVKSIAFADKISPFARIEAHRLLAKIMGHEAPQKVQVESSGVMVMPVAASLEEAETLAAKQQDQLRRDVGE